MERKLGRLLGKTVLSDKRRHLFLVLLVVVIALWDGKGGMADMLSMAERKEPQPL